jgi:Na+/phosphate symporter
MDAPAEKEIKEICALVESTLLEKNKKYGNSALQPLNCFARTTSALDQLYVQIDHKLARIARGDVNREDEDVLLDLVGYLVLVMIARRIKNAP